MDNYTESGIYYDTIAQSGTYAITADGAQGGSAVGHTGGLGAAVTGDIYLTSGTVLEIIVGGAGASAANGGGGGGGGGGSFVFETFAGTVALTPLLIAGGGGGASVSSGGGQTAPTGGGSGNHTQGGGGLDLGRDGNFGAGGAFGGGGGGGYTGGKASVYNGHYIAADNGMNGATSFAGGAAGSNGTVAVGGAGGLGGGGGGDFGGGGGGGYGGGAGGGDGRIAVGGGGGGSYDSDLSNVTTASHRGNGLVALELLCYLAGTRILTPIGAVPVEALAIGDAVVTRFGGIRRVKWIGRQRYAPEFIASNPDKWPVCVAADALEPGVPARDLHVSPGHSMLLGDILVLARDLVNGTSIIQVRPDAEVAYFQLDLGTHDCVLAEGAWSETYADAPGLRAQFHNAAEYEALYPGAQPAEALTLCAPRPEAGFRLEGALMNVVARTAVAPGPLEGWLDSSTDWQVTGWARDLAHPELPVALEVLAGGTVIGTTLACAPRADLAAAGKGRCAFTFTSPARLRDEAVTVRRLADGALLPSQVSNDKSEEKQVVLF